MIPSFVSQMLMTFVNNKIKAFGQMTSLHIDTAAKQISLTASLAGEVSPIDARIKYSIEEQDGRTYLVPLELECSREWLTLLSRDLLKENSNIRFEIPPGMATTALKMLKL